MKTKKIFISAGETSGDIHGSNLITQLYKKNPSIEIYGLGRNRMVEAGLHCIHDMSSRSVMWLQTLKKIPELWDIFSDCKRFFDEEKPELVILIDYAGFNFYLARAAKKRGIPVMYYISPQLWAHGPWRVKKLKKLVDKMVVIYPFEEAFFANEGIPVRHVGHPLFDELNARSIDEDFVEKMKDRKNKTVVSLLPGSRKQEIRRLLPILLKAANVIHKNIPSVKFLLSCSNIRNLELIDSITKSYTSANNNKNLSIEIVTEKISEVIKASSLCISSSGTIALEIAFYQVPMVICYRISPFAYFIVKPFMNTPYVSLVNKIAEKTVVPEILMYRDEYKWLASRATELLLSEERRQECIDGLKKIKSIVGAPGASEKAAEEALGMI
ncbi:MAG: lipid-A-disaccharide synthase [Candidatus Scalindua sediminis]|nr:lipid-A-disaccharide synthase [Candidatus Scalindua sediminis]